MKKLVLIAATGLAATALTAAVVVPAAGEAQVHTKQFVSRNIDGHSLGANTFAAAAVDRHAGHIIGYDSYTGHFYPKQNRGVIWDSFALKNGTISVVVHFNGSSPTVFTGRILNGTGKYKGIDGTVTARTAPHNPDKSYITLTYHF
jgi:hypothetical protein